jgi:hypothetical protein
MSTTDSFDLRPPRRPLRIAILLLAIAALGLTMCVRSEQKVAKPAPPQPTQQAPAPAVQQQQTPTKPADDPRYFNATKAPGYMY